MVRKMASVMVAAMLMAACALAGCAGDTGKGEGDSCSPNGDQCGGQLICQPVTGHSGDFCCPTPLQTEDGKDTSSQSNCQPTQ